MSERTGRRGRAARGMCREILRRLAPARFTPHASHPERSVVIGAPHFMPAPAATQG